MYSEASNKETSKSNKALYNSQTEQNTIKPLEASTSLIYVHYKSQNAGP